LLTARFAQELHRRMYGRTWKWAGKLRKKETLPGIDPKDISVELRKLFDDVTYQLQHKTMPLDEIAARFHHRLTFIHPFPNGNGRHARLMTDILLKTNGAEPFDGETASLLPPMTPVVATSRRCAQRTVAITPCYSLSCDREPSSAERVPRCCSHHPGASRHPS
jgi:Fic-DOC domain mobile mystery protein B